MALPSRVQSIAVTYARLAGTTMTTAAFNVQAGDVLVCRAMTEDAGFTLAISDNSAGALTWTLRQSDFTASHISAYIWTTTVPSNITGLTVTTTVSSSTAGRGLRVTTWRGSAGIGVSNKAVGTTAPSVVLTGVSANSAIDAECGDWNAGAATAAWGTGPGAVTSETATLISTHATFYEAFYANAGAAGNKTVAMASVPAGGITSILAIEIRGSASSAVNVNASVAITAQASAVIARIKGAIRPLATTAQATVATARVKGAVRPVALTAQGVAATVGSKGVFRTTASTAQGTTSVVGRKGVSRILAATAQASVTSAGRKGGVRAVAITAQGSVSSSGRKGGVGALATTAQATASFQRTKGVLKSIAISGQGSSSIGSRLGAFRPLVGAGQGLVVFAFTSGGVHSLTGTISLTAQGQAVFGKRKGATRPLLVVAQGQVSTTRRKGIFRSNPMVARGLTASTGRLGSFRGLLAVASGGASLRTAPGHPGSLNLTSRATITIVGLPGAGPEPAPIRILDLSRPLYRCPARGDDFMYPYVGATLEPHRLISASGEPNVVGTAGSYHLKCGGCGFEMDQTLHGADRR